MVHPPYGITIRTYESVNKGNFRYVYLYSPTICTLKSTQKQTWKY